MFSFAWLSFSYTSPASPHSSAAYKAAVVSRGRLIPATWVHGVVQFVLSQLMCQFVHVGLSSDYWFSFNRPDLLSSLLLVLLLIKQVIANPTFFVFFFVSDAFPHDTTSLIISNPSHLFLMYFTLHLRLLTTSHLSQFLLSVLLAPWACPYPLCCLHAQITIIRCLKWSPCKWFSPLIFGKYFHKGFWHHFHSISGIYLFFKMPCNILS